MSLVRLAAVLRGRSAGLAPRLARCSGGSGQVPIFSQEVLQAKAEGCPLVALESTIITHGMPYPHNLETASQVENIIRERGATPATVAILGGELHVGLSEGQLKYLAQARGVVKASRRDLAPIMAKKQDGATTVAGTLIAAELADIPVFVTGGIGGVHRGGEDTLDISADLTELARSRTLVVCSGVKSILDIGRTLEYLETQGVCVCSFGEADDFPAFYTRRSGHFAPHRVRDAEEAARLILSSRTLRLQSGIVVAVPLPEEHAMDEAVIDAAINRSLKEANTKGVHGKEVTPFILAAVAEATAGASLVANIALIKNNALVGADIAVEYNKLRNGDNFKTASNFGVPGAKRTSPSCSRGIQTWSRACDKAREMCEVDAPLLPLGVQSEGPVLVIGGANVDRTYRVTEGTVKLDGSTHGCSAAVCAGGVARNMAEALMRMRGSGSVRLLTAIGDDADGMFIRDVTEGLLLDGCVVKGGRTASYAAVMDANGSCMLGLGDMDLHHHITPDLVDKNIEVLKDAPLVVIDGNPPQETIDHVLQLCHQMKKPGVDHQEITDSTITAPTEQPAVPTTETPTSMPTAETPVDLIASDPSAITAEPDLDPVLLAALGESISDSPEFGPSIHDSLAKIWLPLLTKGLGKEHKENLLKQHLVPNNCQLLQAPKLNPEVSAAVSEVVRGRDRKFLKAQQQLGQGIAAMNKAMDILLKTDNKAEALASLGDAGRILSDLHNFFTKDRIKLITPSLDKTFVHVVQDTERDELLFGNKLPEKIRASKAIEKQGHQIKKSVNTPKSYNPSTSNARPSTSQGNWSGPPRFSPNRGGRGGGRGRTNPSPMTRRPYISNTAPTRAAPPPPAHSKHRAQPH